eukprot:6395850-Alexandrium_andersonii.AAC.1
MHPFTRVAMSLLVPHTVYDVSVMHLYTDGSASDQCDKAGYAVVAIAQHHSGPVSYTHLRAHETSAHL